MPWFFAIPEFLKKRACRYLLQHYLGQFLEEKINLDDLTVDLYSGTGTITNVPLSVEAVNEALQGTGAPVKVLSGYLGRVTVSVPWTALLKDSCKVEVSGLTLSVVPLIASSRGEEQISMTDSLFFSMTSSRQMAEEVLRSGPSPGEESIDDTPGFEGMEALARAIEMVLAKVQITLTDATVQVNYRTPDASCEHHLKLRVQRVEFFDEQCQRESSVDSDEGEEPPKPVAVAVKVLQLSRLSVELGSNDLTSAGPGREEVDDDLSTLKCPPDCPTSSFSSSSSSLDDQAPPTDSRPGILVAMASGDVNVKVKISQSESLPGPKLEVEGVMGCVHVLLSPHQLQVLTEMATGIATTGGSPQTFEKVHPGQSRPIPKTDMGRVLEPQLTRHVREEREKKQAREALLHADPWDTSLRQFSMAESTHSSGDEFFSLDLASSYSGGHSGNRNARSRGYSREAFDEDGSTTIQSEESFVSTKPRAPPSTYGHILSRSPDSTLESIPLHEGFGLQQLSASPSKQPGAASSRRAAALPCSPPSLRARSSSSCNSIASSSASTLRGREDAHSHVTDYQQDVCRYTLTISGITITLLESDYNYTYTSPAMPRQSSTCSLGACSSGSDGLSSLDEGGLDPVKYFDSMSVILRTGVNRKAVQMAREGLEQVLPTDHLLLWLSTVRASVTTEGPQVGLDISVASSELWEYLYRNEANLPHITRPVSVSPVVQLMEEPGRPSLRLKLSTSISSSPPPRKRAYGVSPSDQGPTSLEVCLTSATVSADVTLLDRLQPLLSGPRRTSLRTTSLLEKTNQSLYLTTSNYYAVEAQRQAVFNQTVAAESPVQREHKISVRLSCDSVNVSLRFPVPDLREMTRPPWFHPSLRPEVLFVTLCGVGVATVLSPTPSMTEVTSVDMHFATAQAYLSPDGSPEARELFLTVGPLQLDTQHGLGNNLSAARVSVTIQEPSESVLDELTRTSTGRDSSHDFTTLEEMELDVPPSSPASLTPFSAKRAMFSTVKPEAAEEDNGGHSEQLVLPGSPQEMATFEQHASSLAQYAVRCTLPTVSIHLPSKHFLDTLYNRFGTDLLLWQPASPQSAEKANTAKSMFLSCMDSIMQPAVTREERFRLCKSALREEESEGENSDEGTAGPAHARTREGGGLSQLAFSVNVERCRVSMLPEAEVCPAPSREAPDEDDDASSVYHSIGSTVPLVELSPKRTCGRTVDREHGLVVMDVSELRLFAVSGYMGDSNHSYFCAQVWRLSLSHLGSLEAAGYPSYSCLDGSSDPSVLSQLLPIIYPTPEGMRVGGSGPMPAQGGGAGRVWREDPPMVAVAMEIRMDQERNTKTNKCALALHHATARHHVTPAEHSCFKQLKEFFDLVEEDVPGYEPPSFITELHVHLEDCGVEYRPLHLPLRTLLTTSSINLSTSLVTGSPVLRVRLMVDGTHLFLSDRTAEYLDLHQDYLCVLDLDWLELTIRLCNNSQCDPDTKQAPVLSRLPEVTIECSSNVLHLHTCVDSCIALRDLLNYVASHGDLRPPEAEGGAVRPYSSLATDLMSAPSSLSSNSGSPPINTNGADASIGDLISEAMEDDSLSASVATASSSTAADRHAPSQGEGPRGQRRDHASSRSDRVARRKSRESSTTSKLQIHQSSEKSIHICFSDSDDEDGETVDSVGVRGTEGRGRGGERGAHGEGRRNVDSDKEDEDGFCIVDTPTSTAVAPGARPVVKSLLEGGEQLEVVENHFTVPDRRTDQLHRPADFPEPTMQYTLKEITIVWHLYGGSDFSPAPKASSSSPHSSSPSPGSSPMFGRRLSRDSLPLTSQVLGRRRSNSGGHSPSTGRRRLPDPVAIKGTRRSATGGRGGGPADWRLAGGPGRDHNVLMEIELDKLRIQHETFPHDTEQSSRLVLLVRDMEVRDRLAQSQINKFLYQYTTDAMPRQSHANMVSLKVLFTRPEVVARPDIEEASVRLSMLPIRLNMDQDAVFFLLEFFKQVGDTSSISVPQSGSANGTSTPPEGVELGTGSPTHPNEVFIRSFVFHPDLPIRIDYVRKGFHTEAVGTLAGILLGLSHLDSSEVTLKALTHKNGLLGWEKVFVYAGGEWLSDIKTSQLPHILKGVGPMYHVTQLLQGMYDLFRLPYDQYMDDGRIVWGIQRGASSFTTSSGIAIVELTSRTLETVQWIAQMAYDLVTPTDLQGSGPGHPQAHQSKAPHQPLDFREGVANAYDVVTTGIGGTARDLVNIAAQEHEERGMTGAVGGVLRQIPGTIVKPIILASEATRHVLGGVKNQFVPDARREAQEKWRTTDSPGTE